MRIENAFDLLITFNNDKISLADVFDHRFYKLRDMDLRDTFTYHLVSNDCVYKIARAIDFYKHKCKKLSDEKVKDLLWNMSMKELMSL